MFKTADTIEESKSLKPGIRPARKIHPNSLKNLVAPYPKGVSGNPGGKNQYDVAREIARAVFSNNKEEIYKAMSKALLAGNAYVFKELSDRAYDKLRESKEVHVYQETEDKDLDERIAAIERDLGLARAIDEAGGVASSAEGTGKTNGETQTPELLPR